MNGPVVIGGGSGHGKVSMNTALKAIKETYRNAGVVILDEESTGFDWNDYFSVETVMDLAALKEEMDEAVSREERLAWENGIIEDRVRDLRFQRGPKVRGPVKPFKLFRRRI